jgi:hypothetical protein
MTWFRIDDGFYDHPKVKALPRGATRKGAVFLWTAAGSWCARYLTDGLIPGHQIDELGATKKDAAALVATVLWHGPGHDCPDCQPVPAGHFLYHHWDHYQATRDQVEKDRAAARERMANRRNKPPKGDDEQ